MALIMGRPVYNYNLAFEMDLIRQSMVNFNLVSIDTEFPGVIFDPPGVPVNLRSCLSPAASYANMNKNVDSLKLIQLGLTLSDAEGNMPSFGSPYIFFWEFNFQDFDLHNPESTSHLKSQGIDFSRNNKIGIDSRHFAFLFTQSGLGSRFGATWITFYGMYDFGFMIKILTGCYLPNNLEEFLTLVKGFFGHAVIDVKCLIGFAGLHGGLDRVGKNLNLDRAMANISQSGSGSFLTMQVFLALKKKGLDDTNGSVLRTLFPLKAAHNSKNCFLNRIHYTVRIMDHG